MSRILVVDDKEMMRDSVAATLARKGHNVVAASGGAVALEKLSQRTFDALITDLQMPEMNGLQLLKEVRQIDEHLPVIFMTAYGTVDTAVSAMKDGAFDYITKPFSGDEILVAIDRAVKHGKLIKENQILRAAASPAGNESANVWRKMIGSGPTMTRIKERLFKIADSQGTVLISGESGTGKEVAARCIHMQSPRAKMPFLALNCAALSTSLLESELFGHEKGAFTGADKLRKGRFELADGGTLLLDEISEISPTTQAKLLRVLQERTFERVGSSTSRTVDVRVIATTNRDLPAEVARRTFRQDLYFRLNVLPLRMPPLREIIEELGDLAENFLKHLSTREGKPLKMLEPGVLQLMSEYSWPGNVRELQNICERAAVLTQGETIKTSLIAPWLSGVEAPRNLPASMIEVSPLNDLTSQTGDVSQVCQGIVCDGRLTLDDIEREAIIATLKVNNGHRQRSATALGIGVRTLGLKLKKWKDQQLVSQTL